MNNRCTFEFSTCSGSKLVNKILPRWPCRPASIANHFCLILWPGRLNFLHQYKNFIACQCADLLLLGVSNIIWGGGLFNCPTISVGYQVRVEEENILVDILYIWPAPFSMGVSKKYPCYWPLMACDVTKWIIASTLTGVLLELSTCSGFQLVSKLPPRWLWRLSWIVGEVF